MQAQFAASAYKNIDSVDDTYVNARYAPVGNEKVGMPFPLFKQPAYYNTDYTPAGQTPANLKRRMDLPTNNTLFRNTVQGDGVGLQNKQNNAWVYRTQTLANNGDTLACRNNADCEPWTGTTCNPQFMSWNDAKGNQGNYCSVTKYPELENGKFHRKDAYAGGIGKSCKTDDDCGSGYLCNNETDMFGKNIQQTGFCSQQYDCPDGSHYMGYPYGAGTPISPPPGQNNGGRGYNTKAECVDVKLAQQDCKQDANHKWFATYPGYCPVVSNLRSPSGMLPQSSMATVTQGIKIPAYATNQASFIGKPNNAFISWNLNASPSLVGEMSGPLKYELAINPNPK